ncbi:MAG: rubredoxin [Thermoproteota archaeon]
MSDKTLRKYLCTACGYVYDPFEGDPVGEIPPKTPFASHPDTWVCPICGATKDLFEPID